MKFFFSWLNSPSGPRPPNYREFMITLRYATLGTIPLDEWSVRRKSLYLATKYTHMKQTFMAPAGLEPAIPANDRSQPHFLDRASTGIGNCWNIWARCSFVECFNHPVRVFFCKWHRLELAGYIYRSFEREIEREREEGGGERERERVILFRRNKQQVLPIHW